MIKTKKQIEAQRKNIFQMLYTIYGKPTSNYNGGACWNHYGKDFALKYGYGLKFIFPTSEEIVQAIGSKNAMSPDVLEDYLGGILRDRDPKNKRLDEWVIDQAVSNHGYSKRCSYWNLDDHQHRDKLLKKRTFKDRTNGNGTGSYVNAITDEYFHPDNEYCDENWLRWAAATHDGGRYHLDKDILVHRSKVYGPLTCLWLTPQENTLIVDNSKENGMPLCITVDDKNPDYYTVRLELYYRDKKSRKGMEWNTIFPKTPQGLQDAFDLVVEMKLTYVCWKTNYLPEFLKTTDYKARLIFNKMKDLLLRDAEGFNLNKDALSMTYEECLTRLYNSHRVSVGKYRENGMAKYYSFFEENILNS